MERIRKCPRFSTICSAVDGDEIAMEKILNHYNAYISKACLRPCYDEYGNMRIVVDMEFKRAGCETAIMKAILNFELEIKVKIL